MAGVGGAGGGKENLIPFSELPEDEQRRIRSKGGKRSGEVRREKKRMSQIYADILAKQHNIKIGRKMQTMSGPELIEWVTLQIIKKANSVSATMLKEMREATEGSTLDLTGQLELSVDDKRLQELPYEERRKAVEAWLKKTKR